MGRKWFIGFWGILGAKGAGKHHAARGTRSGLCHESSPIHHPMKTNTRNPTESISCFECKGGVLQPILEDHVTRHPKLGDITVPGVPMLRCDQCGDVVIGDEGNARIDAFLDAGLAIRRG